MLQKSTTLTANYTALISLLNIDTTKPITIGLSKALTAADTFNVYGTLDAAAVDNTNADQIGTISGTTPADLLKAIAAQAALWPHVFLLRTGGSRAGNFFLTGEEALAGAATVSSTAAPAVGSFTAAINLLAYGAEGVRIGGDAAMLDGDVFDVYVAQDSTITNATGAKKLGRITGGGSPANRTSLIAEGWPYAIITTIARESAGGNLLAAGVKTPAAGGTGYWQQGGNAFGATGVLGTTDAQTMTLIGNNTTFLSDDGTITTLGRLAGASSVVINAGTGNIDIGTSASARQINIGTGAAVQTITIGSANGASTVSIVSGTGAINIGTGNQARTINIGTGTAAQTIVLGSTDTTSSVTINAGTGNIDIGTSAAARTINIGTGNAAQTINIGTGNAAHTINIGTGTTAQTINVGTGAANVITIGNTTDPAEIRLRVSRGVGINTAGMPNSSAILELVSTTRGLLFPRMTQAQRDAIGTPAAGLVIYNTDTNKLNMRAAAAWEAVTSA